MILPNTKIEKALDPKDLRTYLHDPHFDGSRIVATNGRIMAVIPVEVGKGDTPGPVPLEAIKLARKTKLPDIELSETEALAAGVKFPREDKGKYPDFEQVIPKESTEKPDLVIDAKLLYELALALSTNTKEPKLKLWFARRGDDPQDIDPDGAIRVKAGEQDHEGFGVIMPCR